MEFVYSKPYDDLFGAAENSEKIGERISSLNKLFGIYSDKIFSEIEKQSGLQWRHRPGTGYTIQNLPIRGISHPLSIRITDDVEEMILTAISELVKVIYLQNPDELENLKHKYMAEYRDLDEKTILNLIFLETINNVVQKVMPDLYEKNINLNLKEGSLKKAQEILNEKK